MLAVAAAFAAFGCLGQGKAFSGTECSFSSSLRPGAPVVDPQIAGLPDSKDPKKAPPPISKTPRSILGSVSFSATPRDFPVRVHLDLDPWNQHPKLCQPVGGRPTASAASEKLAEGVPYCSSPLYTSRVHAPSRFIPDNADIKTDIIRTLAKNSPCLLVSLCS